MITIKKHRRTVNGVTITLMEKMVSEVDITNVERFSTSEIEQTLREYIDQRLETFQPQAQQTITEVTDPETGIVTQVATPLTPAQAALTTLTTQDILDLILNTPEDGNIIVYNGDTNSFVWDQQYDPTDTEKAIEDINLLIEEIQDLLATHTHTADDIYAGTFPDNEYTFTNEVRQQTSSFIDSSKTEKFQIKYNSTTNTLDILYVG